MRVKRNRFILFFIGMISFVLLSGLSPDAIREKLEEGDTLISEKKYDEADKMFNSILQEVNIKDLNPQEELSKNMVIPKIHFRLGEIRNKQKKYKDAKSYFRKVVDSQFETYWKLMALFNIGLIDHDLKNYKEARGSFNRIVTEYQDSKEAPQSLYYIGLCFELEGIKTEAVNSYKKFLKLYPKHSWSEKVKAKLDIK